MWDEDNFGDVTRRPFVPVTPNSLVSSWNYKNSQLYSERFTLLGTVQEVLPPSNPKNRSKVQYEYIVAAVGELNSHKSLHCILRDHYGGINDFETFTLKMGQRVTVSCVQGNPDSSVIIGGVQNTTTATPEVLGHFWMNRFNNITRSVTSASEYYIKNDSGTSVSVQTDQIVINDANANQIVVNQAAKNITITDSKGESIVIDQAANTITINAKTLNVNVSGDMAAKVSGKATIDATNINLNGEGGMVVTNGPNSYSHDYITGIPIIGVPNLKAGK